MLGIAFALLAGCASSPSALPFDSQIEVAFSPDTGSEALVLKVIGGARSSIRLAGYSFTSPSVVRALTDANDVASMCACSSTTRATAARRTSRR